VCDKMRTHVLTAVLLDFVKGGLGSK